MTRNVRESEFEAMRKRAIVAERERDELRSDWDAEHKHCVYMKNSANEIAREVEKLRIELAERNEECEEFRAHCERLREALQSMVDEAAHLAGFSESTERVVLDALNETPQAARAQSAEPVAWMDGDYVTKGPVSNCSSWVPLYTAQPPAREQVPSGWQLVPVEPTGEMLRRGTWSGNGDVGVDEEWARKVVYQRMLAASPEPPEE